MLDGVLESFKWVSESDLEVSLLERYGRIQSELEYF